MLENELIRVKARLPDQGFPDQKFTQHSAYIGTGVELNARDFVGPRFSDLQDSEGQLWPYIADDNGEYHFEIATELPFYLPECYGPEQFLQVSNNRLFFCNRMVRAFFGDGYPDTDGLNYILTHRADLDQIANRVGHLHPIPIKTFVSKNSRLETLPLKVQFKVICRIGLANLSKR